MFLHVENTNNFEKTITVPHEYYYKKKDQIWARRVDLTKHSSHRWIYLAVESLYKAMMALRVDLLHYFNMMIALMIGVSSIKPTSPYQNVPALHGRLLKYLVCQNTVNGPEPQNIALASTSSGPCPVLDLFVSFLIRGTLGQKLANNSWNKLANNS